MTPGAARTAVRRLATLVAGVFVLGATASCTGETAGETARFPGAIPAPANVSAASGRLVGGIPVVVPVPPGATVTTSAVGHENGLLTVSVTGTSGEPAADLLAFFRERLTLAAFTATEGSPLPEGAVGAVFGRGEREVLLVAIVDHGVSRSWSLGGTLAP
ncbi:MAG: hypothetical protein QG622_448 [Actinomycetota bacterium]|nr:hypothetical protein [Actinomycetota bacterium]